MKLTEEQLHERGPPLTKQQRNKLSKEASLFTTAGFAAMTATAIDAILLSQDHDLTRSEIITHAVGEGAGFFMIAGFGAVFAQAARKTNATMQDVQDYTRTAMKALGLTAGFALSVASINHVHETQHSENDRRVHSAEAKTLPKLGCDKRLYDSAETTPRHFAQGRETFIFQGHLVDCSAPPPRGFQPLPPAIG